MDFPPELKKVYSDGRLLPFIGAGISMSVNWDLNGAEKRGPSWKELVDQATRMLQFENPELIRARGTDLQVLEYFKTKKDGQIAQLTNWLLTEMRAPDSALKDSKIHRELASLKKCKILYTTNFDDLIERSFDLFKRKFVSVVTEKQMWIAQNNECEIIKFHGDLNNPNMLVLTESDYERRLSFATELDYRLKSDLLNRTVLFIGYSFRDPNVAYLFRLVSEQFKNQHGLEQPRAYIVVKNPSNFENLLFNNRKIKVIPANTSDLTTFIANLLHFIRT